jgi:hypothetical protein
MNNYFNALNGVNVNSKVEKKNGLTYLSWAWAWGEVKKLYPTTTYTIYENATGWNYHTDGKTAWVKTGVTVEGIEHIEYLPVMDLRNKSIPLESVTSFDVNKAIQRSLTKALARHGLGLYIYAGEDLPEDEKPDFSAMAQSTITKVQANAMATMIKNFGADQEKMLEAYKVASLDELNNEQYADIVRKLKAKYEKK